MRLPTQVLVYLFRYTDGQPEYLMLHRLASRDGFWQGVTGAPEPGENLLQTAERELREETGFTVSAIQQIDYSYSFPVADKWRASYAEGVTQITEFVFLARHDSPSDPTIDPGEHDQWRWCDLASALELLTWPESKQALILCHELLTGLAHHV